MQNTQCELPDANLPSDQIRTILSRCKRIAVVGISPKESRDSHRVARYMIAQGYDIIPINPGQHEILGQTCYKTIADIPFPVDMANLFLNPTRIPPVVDQAIAKGVPVIWMQMGVVHNTAAQKAREAGIQVVMNKCIMQEHKKMETT
jgi:uncharacterized protein